MKQVLFEDGVALRQIIEYARANDCMDTLARSLLYLLQVATMDMVKPFTRDTLETLEPSDGDTLTLIGKDFAPYSLGFAIMRDAHAQRCMEQASRIMNGGFIYRGPQQPHDGSAPALTVSLGQPRTLHDWTIHT